MQDVIRTHYSKEERHLIGRVRGKRKEKIVVGKTSKESQKVVLERVQRRKWTLNRSPHGNKTARQQRGREQWKRRMRRPFEVAVERNVALAGFGAPAKRVRRKSVHTDRE